MRLMMLYLVESNVFQPDIMFVSNHNSKIIKEKNVTGAPDLIIEILSPATGYYDLTEKKEIYAEFGVKEYWIVDPKKKWVEIYANESKKFKSIQRLEKSRILKSHTLSRFDPDGKNLPIKLTPRPFLEKLNSALKALFSTSIES